MNTELTQHFSTWGDKLLQHCDVLNDLQQARRVRPITVQLAPTELCDSNCTFCSVANRPRGVIPFGDIMDGLEQFADLGAKSVEITGGGNPLIYRHGKHYIQDVVNVAVDNALNIGIITNSLSIREKLRRYGIQWVRVSLAKLDEGKKAKDYDFHGFEDCVGLSYIIHDRTTPETVREIAKLVELWPTVKFVRVAPDCTTDDALTIESKWGEMVRRLDKDGNWFIKDIGDNYHPYPSGCWVGGLRPYWTSTGIYICTSHVLKTRKYEPEWRLCGVDEIAETWGKMTTRLKEGRPPYDIDISKCWHCYYYNNNRILDTVTRRLPDWEFA